MLERAEKGTKDDVRWVLGMSEGSNGLAWGCTAFVVGGTVQPGGSGGGGPAFEYPGTYNIKVLGGMLAGLPDGRSLGVTGGTVSNAATRVVISDGNGASTDATLVNGGSDPARHYFAGMLIAPAMNNAAMRVTIVAYDAAGHEVGRFSPPPI